MWTAASHGRPTRHAAPHAATSTTETSGSVTTTRVSQGLVPALKGVDVIGLVNHRAVTSAERRTTDDRTRHENVRGAASVRAESKGR